MSTTLLDIGDLTMDVSIGKVTITMKGLSAKDIFGFLVRYPVLRELFDKSQADKSKVSHDSILTTAPQAVYEAVAMCDVGLPRDAAGVISPKHLKQAAKKVENLSISTQLKLVNAFFDLTFEDGVGPFVDAWVVLMKRFNQMKAGVEVAVGQASVENSPAQSDEFAFTVDTPYVRRGVRHLAS